VAGSGARKLAFVERFIVAHNGSYEVVERGKQVYFRPAAAPAVAQ
jgi:hypothetical protein